jgi:hypothetical protein
LWGTCANDRWCITGTTWVTLGSACGAPHAVTARTMVSPICRTVAVLAPLKKKLSFSA